MSIIVYVSKVKAILNSQEIQYLLKLAAVSKKLIELIEILFDYARSSYGLTTPSLGAKARILHRKLKKVWVRLLPQSYKRGYK